MQTVAFKEGKRLYKFSQYEKTKLCFEISGSSEALRSIGDLYYYDRGLWEMRMLWINSQACLDLKGLIAILQKNITQE